MIDAETEGRELAAQPGRAHGVRRRWARSGVEDRILCGYFLVVVLGFFALTALGITQSSIGVGSLQTDGMASSDVLVGQPRAIRGDEFSRSSPLILGQAAQCSADFTSPLGQDPTITAGTVNSGIAEHLVFFDRTFIQATCGLPDSIQFAGYWWEWMLLAAVALPLLLRIWGVPLPLIAFATVGALVAPSNAWWSYSPTQPLALAAVVACALGAAGKVTGRFRLLWYALAVGAGGIALARLPFAYFPFAFPIALALILPMFVMGVVDHRTRRLTLVLSALILLCGAGLALGVLLENRAAVEALSQTLYPGERRESGQLLSLGLVFGAPFLGQLQFVSEVPGSNPSELSTGWTVAAIPAVLVAARAAPIGRKLGRSAPVFWTLSALLAAMLSWVLFNWPERLGQALPLVSSIPPGRMVAVIGIPAVVLLAVVLTPVWRTGAESPDRRWLAPGVLIAVVFLLLIAGSSLQLTNLPSLGSVEILTIAGLVGLSFAAMGSGRANFRYAGLALALIGMASTVWRVSPVMVGLGDLRGSSASDAVLAAAGQNPDPGGGYWATDSWELTTLLTSNGIPTANGDQWTGPTNLWLKLDPERRYEEAWNRGASVIGFDWDAGSDAPVITSPQADAITITVSPCDPALRDVGVRALVSTRELSASCLRLDGEFEYAGVARYMYVLTP